ADTNSTNPAYFTNSARNYNSAGSTAARHDSLQSGAGVVVARDGKPSHPVVVVGAESGPVVAFGKRLNPAIPCGECSGKGWLLCEGYLRLSCDVCQETGDEPCCECDDGTPATVLSACRAAHAALRNT